MARGTSKREDVLDTIIRLIGKDSEEADTTTFELRYLKHRQFWGADAAPMTLHVTTASGTSQWRSEGVSDPIREEIAAMRKQGMKQSDIAERVGKSQSQVSRILNEVDTEDDEDSSNPADTGEVVDLFKATQQRRDSAEDEE